MHIAPPHSCKKCFRPGRNTATVFIQKVKDRFDFAAKIAIAFDLTKFAVQNQLHNQLQTACQCPKNGKIGTDSHRNGRISAKCFIKTLFFRYFASQITKERTPQVPLSRAKIALIAAALALVVAGALTSCSQERMSNSVVAQNQLFTVTGDSVTEGDWTAHALSATHLVSNYAPTDSVAAQEPDTTQVLHFRLAFNGHDNEMLPGRYHTVRLGADTALVTACEPSIVATGGSTGTRLTVRADLRPVLAELEATGRFVTPTGDTVRREEFHGVWIAGDVKPLSLNFSTLASRSDLKLHTTAEPGIYEITLQLQPAATAMRYAHEWKIERPDAAYPMLYTDHNLINALYNMSVHDIAASKHDGAYATDQSEMSYAIMLSLATLDPDGAKATLRRMTSDGRLRRSYSSPYAWPVTAGDVAWAMAAWEAYVVSGDRQWLKWALGVLQRSVEADVKMSRDASTGLLHGGVNYGFANTQCYPAWMQPSDIFESQSLTVNVLYCRALEIMNDMADELDIASDYGEQHLQLKDAINTMLWNERHGYYSQYTLQEAYPTQSPGIDNMGQALSVLLGVADDDRAENLLMKTPITHYGIPTVSPRFVSFDDVNLSETVSPIVQAFWNMAAAKAGNDNMLRRGLAALYRAEAMFCANRRAWHAFSGEAIASADGDLSCAASNAAMVLRVFAGMTFLPGGIEFNPVIPVFFTGTKRLNGLHYRQAVIDLTIEGTGSDIKSITIDGKSSSDNFIPADLTGRHSVRIEMQAAKSASQQVTVAGREFAIPATPLVQWGADSVRVFNYHSSGDGTFRFLVNGTFRGNLPDSVSRRPATSARGLTLSNIVCIGRYAFSYPSKPTLRAPQQWTLPTANTADSLQLQFSAPEAGDYMLDLSYSNGQWQGQCPALQVVVNTHTQGVCLLPATAQDEWLRTGRSNMVRVQLLRGPNTIVLRRQTGTPRHARLHSLRLLKM